jgi:transcriptional regulator with XRE-family HTH domain
MSFASRLKRIRQERGMTQRELADFVGVGFSTLTNWEQGSREPSLLMLKALCKALEVDCNVFLAGDDSDETESPPTPRGRPKREAEAPAEPEVKRPRGRPKKSD